MIIYFFQKADLAIADLTITYEREQAVDFTMPFMNLGKKEIQSSLHSLHFKQIKNDSKSFSISTKYNYKGRSDKLLFKNIS
jgi:hypothetical protein